MKVQVPTDEETEKLRDDFALNLGYGYANNMTASECRAFEDLLTQVIAYANEQLASPPPTKRPFLSDLEIDTMWGTDACRQGARWARDKYEARDMQDVPSINPRWRPEPGDRCAFWTDSKGFIDIGIFDHSDEPEGRMFCARFVSNDDLDYGWYEQCAALESIDEIGKPPQYFIERGRCTV